MYRSVFKYFPFFFFKALCHFFLLLCTCVRVCLLFFSLFFSFVLLFFKHDLIQFVP